MIKINKKDRKFITDNIPEAAALLDGDSLRDVLLIIDGYMTTDGYMPPDYEVLNDKGRQAERIFDRLFYDN